MPIPDRGFTILNTGQRIVLEGGFDVTSKSPDGSTRQSWRFKHQGNETYYIFNQGVGGYMAASSGSPTPGLNEAVVISRKPYSWVVVWVNQTDFYISSYDRSLVITAIGFNELVHVQKRGSSPLQLWTVR